jgi:hypothetical protein
MRLDPIDDLAAIAVIVLSTAWAVLLVAILEVAAPLWWRNRWAYLNKPLVWWLKRQGWVVFYLDPEMRRCSGKVGPWGCYLALYEEGEGRRPNPATAEHLMPFVDGPVAQADGDHGASDKFDGLVRCVCEGYESGAIEVPANGARCLVHPSKRFARGPSGMFS